VKKSKIYTKTGDKGETGLVSGNRALKSDLRIDLYGELDELNSRIGHLCTYTKGRDLDFLHRVQSTIFDLGSNLACEVDNRQKYNLPQISVKIIGEIEDEIDRMDAALEPLKNFVLPGGSLEASVAHLCRTGTRGVERKLIHYHHITKEELPEGSVIFVNRLSDYFFVLARHLNKANGTQEVLWKPSQVQKS
jgi:cob(I)alamin adenosyltransferase